MDQRLLLTAGGGPSRGLALPRRGQGCDHNRAGRLRSDGLPLPTGPPHGFHEHFYFGEVNRCRTLHDPEGLLRELKSAASIYSPKLKRPLVAKYPWEAGFSLEIARKPPARGEPPASRVPV